MNRSWFPTMFDDFFDGEWTPKVSAAAPAVNVKEDAKEVKSLLLVLKKNIAV